MTLFPFDGPTESTGRLPTPISVLDAVLTAQFVVAWAGEHGEGDRPSRLGWWRSDLISEYGGFDLFRRLTHSTWEWAAWRAVREAARRCDLALRTKDHDPDRLCTLFSLGFEIDERVDERLRELALAGRPPHEVLPGLAWTREDWNRRRFEEWVAGHGPAKHKSTPVGIEVEGDASVLHPEEIVRRCVAVLIHATTAYSLPFVRRRTG